METIDTLARFYVYAKVTEMIIGIILLPFAIYEAIKAWKNIHKM